MLDCRTSNISLMLVLILLNCGLYTFNLNSSVMPLIFLNQLKVFSIILCLGITYCWVKISKLSKSSFLLPSLPGVSIPNKPGLVTLCAFNIPSLTCSFNIINLSSEAFRLIGSKVAAVSLLSEKVTITLPAISLPAY